MVVAFIEADKYERTAALAIRAWNVLSKLVVEEGADVFLFNNEGPFDNDCWLIVSQLQMLYPNIQRHYYHGGCDYDVGYVDYMSDSYDKVIFPEQGSPFPSNLRDRAMIDRCDVVLTYCNNKQMQSERKSGGALAVELARKMKKRVINLFDA